jgi:hypothetical protein
LNLRKNYACTYFQFFVGNNPANILEKEKSFITSDFLFLFFGSLLSAKKAKKVKFFLKDYTLEKHREKAE